MRTAALLLAGVSVTKGCPTFDAEALLEGASTDVPDEVMEVFPNVLGQPMSRHTAITGVEFHIPGVASSEGMSDVPHPVLRKVNGVLYWQVTGEMSARVVDDFGLYYAVGPIDGDGVNHRHETFDPWEPGVDPDDLASHPRAGNPGAFFAIRWPVYGYNGGIVQHQAPNDGGSGYPQAPLAWQNVDALALMEAGYAVVTLGTGGTAYARKNADGTETLDTNPESDTGIFYTEDWGLWPEGGIYETDATRLVSTIRLIDVSADLEESPVATPLAFDISYPAWDDGAGAFVTFTEHLELPADVTFPLMFYCPEILRDALVVFENFMEQASGWSDPFSAYVGWSGSGHPAWQLATGKQANGLFQFDRALGVPPGGGNFDVWRDPDSGTRYDGFIVFAGGRSWPIFADDAEEHPEWAETDPEYPVQAPYVFLHGDADLVVSGANPYVQSNAAARAWPGSQMASESMDDHLVILHLQKMTHQARDQLFTNWDGPVGPDEDALWFDPSLGYDPASLNTDGVGLRMTETYARHHVYDGTDIQYHAADLAPMPRTTPLYLALLKALRRHAEHGTPLPTSRVDGKVFDHLDSIDENTLFPQYDVPCTYDENSTWDDVLACVGSIDQDSTHEAWTAAPFELDAVHEFAADNPMTWSTEPVSVPDVAAPLGYWYFLGLQLRRDFTRAELVDRYRTHNGYVSAYRAATRSLVEDGLWDPELGALYVTQARDSAVLR